MNIIYRPSYVCMVCIFINPRLDQDVSFPENSVDPDQMASLETSWSGSALFPLWLKIQAYNRNAAG